MKKIYVLFTSIFLASAAAIAQPTLNSANWPTAGTSETSYGLDATSASEGSAGANQTWNFASLTPTGSSTLLQYVAPSSTQYFSSFPSSNSAAITPSISGTQTGYAYYDLNSSYLDLMGFVSNDGAGTVINFPYSDRQRALIFPFTFNSTFTDSYYGVANYTSSGTPVTDYRSGTDQVTADGWGTITTPAGTFSNVLRVKTLETNTDSLDVMGFGFVTVSNVTTYTWVNQNAMQLFVLTYDTADGTGGQTFSKTAQYSSLSTGINSLASYKPLAIYPNPSASSNIHLNADDLKSGKVKFTVTDLNGQEIKNLDFLIKDAARKTIDVEMNDCNPGIYIIQLKQNDAVYTSRFVKL